MQPAHSLEQSPSPAAAYHPEFPPDWRFGEMIGRSPVMQRLSSQMRHTARHLRIATLEGESGVGKMLAARTLHEVGSDPQSPFIPCPAPQLFQQAHQAIALVAMPSIARLEFAAIPALKQSCGGTLVLTRIDELSPPHQGRLLELLQWIDHQHILRALDSIPRQILCLSGQPLRKLVVAGALRTDLVSRLTAIRFFLPPLREHREDIALLADLFAERFSATHGKPVRGLGPQTLPRLLQHAWPGNVRELESVICAAALGCHGQWIRPIDVPVFTAAPTPPPHAPTCPASENDPNLDRAILCHIQRVLTRVDGNKLRAAKMLGISRSTLYRLLDTASAH